MGVGSRWAERRRQRVARHAARARPELTRNVPATHLHSGRRRPDEGGGRQRVRPRRDRAELRVERGVANLTVKKRKNKKKVKVKKVTFRLDNGNQVVDKKSPYVQTLLLANTTPGSLHTLSVNAKMKVTKKGHKPKKKVLKLSKDFFYCP